MRRPPRSPDKRLRDWWTVGSSLAQGLGVLRTATLLYALALDRASDEAAARAMAFTAIVLGNVGLILANRSQRHTMLRTLVTPNRALWWVVGGALGGLYVPALTELFRFAPLNAAELAVSTIAAAAGLAGYEICRVSTPNLVPPSPPPGAEPYLLTLT